MRLLLIEDETRLARIIERVLKQEGFDVDVAAGMFLGTVADSWQQSTVKTQSNSCRSRSAGLVFSHSAMKVRPNPPLILAIRGLMLVIAAGSLSGVYEHVTGNLEFVHEVRRNANRMTVLRDTLQGGAPVLAPGILAIGAIITLAAAYAQRALTAEPARLVAQANRITTPTSPTAHDRLFVRER